jgi:tryptophan 7-halogenase
MDLFGPTSWTAVHLGQLNFPQRCDPLLDYRKTDGRGYLEKLRKAMQSAADGLPTHQAYIDQNCKAIPLC